MAATDTERPTDAVKAARALATSENRSVVGIGDFYAFYASQVSDEHPDGKILVCHLDGFDYCDTENRFAAHSKILFEVDQSDPDLDLASNSEALV